MTKQKTMTAVLGAYALAGAFAAEYPGVVEIETPPYFNYSRAPSNQLKHKRYKKQMRGGRPAQIRTEPKIGRNELCPCGSGKKYKRCCQK